MSLINQALRKAQRDRTPNRIAEPDAGGPATAAPTAASGMNPSLIIGLIVAVAVLLGLVAGLSIVLFKGGESAPMAQQAPTQQTPSTAASEPVAAPPEPLVPAAPTMASSSQTTPLERDTTTNLVGELRKAREAAEAKAATEAIAAEEAAARAAVKPSQKIIDWLTRAKVTGVMLSETNSKVILNGKTYAVGDYANYSLGLKIMIIQEKRLLFVDNNGKKYMKRF